MPLSRRRTVRMLILLFAASAALLAVAPHATALRDLTSQFDVVGTPVDNGTFPVNVTALNLGDSAAGPVTLQLYVDGNATSTLHDFGQVASNTTVSAIENLTLACGWYWLNLTVDPGNQVPESNETNNTYSRWTLVPPYVDAAVTQSGPLGAIVVTLDASASHGCEPLNFTWQMAGQTRYGAVASFTPPAGTHTFSLTVRAEGDPSITASINGSVVVPNAAPSVEASVPGSAISTFDAVGLVINATDMDGSIASLAVDMGDGNTTLSPGEAANHTYARGGNYTIIVVATDNLGASNSTSLVVTIANRAPLVEASVPHTSLLTLEWLGLVVTTSDPDGAVASVVVDAGDGNTTLTAAQAASHAYRRGGNFTVLVTVTDDQGATNSTSLQISVSNRVPTVELNASTTSATVGTPVSFDASGSSDPEGAALTYAWDFGDGATATGEAANHTYAANGTYTVTLRVTDADGGVHAQSATVQVADAAVPAQVPRDDWILPVVGGILGLLLALLLVLLLIRRRRPSVEEELGLVEDDEGDADVGATQGGQAGGNPGGGGAGGPPPPGA